MRIILSSFTFFFLFFLKQTLFLLFLFWNKHLSSFFFFFVTTSFFLYIYSTSLNSINFQILLFIWGIEFCDIIVWNSWSVHSTPRPLHRFDLLLLLVTISFVPSLLLEWKKINTEFSVMIVSIPAFIVHDSFRSTNIRISNSLLFFFLHLYKAFLLLITCTCFSIQQLYFNL